jgi:glycosyltransferase involved in cell wall biosynthesis
VRVLSLINSVGGSGGAEHGLAAIAPDLRREGIQLHVAFFDAKPGLQERMVAGGIELHHLSTGDSHVQRTFAVRSAIRDLQPQLLHTSLFEADIAGRIAARLARVPVVSSLVNVTYGPEQRAASGVPLWKLRAVQVLDAATAHLTVALHAVSDHVADTMSQQLRYPRSRIEVIPRGRDPRVLGDRSMQRRERVRSHLELNTEPIVVAAARHEPQKGLDILLRATALLIDDVPNVQLLIAGRNGRSTAELQRLVDEHDLAGHVQFLGVRTDVADLIAAADVVAIPARWEGIPNVMIEAMALGTPVVASDIPPVREVMGPSEWARLVEPGNARAFASALADAIRMGTEPDRTRAAQERFSEEYTVSAVASRMARFFRRSAGEAAHAN